MFEKQGHQVDLFDKFYVNNPAVFKQNLIISYARIM
jgi:hypothetical protein